MSDIKTFGLGFVRTETEIRREAYQGTEGYLVDGFSAWQWRRVAEETGDDLAYLISAVLDEMDEIS